MRACQFDKEGLKKVPGRIKQPRLGFVAFIIQQTYIAIITIKHYCTTSYVSLETNSNLAGYSSA